MRALAIVLACLASVASAEDKPKKKLSYIDPLNETKLVNDTQLELGDKYVSFPATPRGAPRNVRAALCPKSIEITGINKRALGCTIGDIFGPSNLDQEYLTKLRRWALEMSEKGADNPYAFRPQIDLNLEALTDAHLDEYEAEVTKPASKETEAMWNEKKFGKYLIPDPMVIPDDKKPWEANEAAKDPEGEVVVDMAELEQSLEDLLAGPDKPMEIKEEDKPWNAPEKPKVDLDTPEMKQLEKVLFGTGSVKKLKPEEMPWIQR